MSADAAGQSGRSPAEAGKVATATKPRFALFVTTACGLGYIPVAPGTFGALGGAFLALVPWLLLVTATYILGGVDISGFDPILLLQCLIALILATIGVWTAGRAARFWQQDDPQSVVIDEVSGQHLTLLLGCGIPVWWKAAFTGWDRSMVGLITLNSVVSWKYLLLGLILFRLFDIWKPFPVRQAESLPGGWGIMADDWFAAIYAAIGLWIARAAGL